MIVPDGGRGRTRQIRLSLRAVRAAAAAGAVAVAVLLGLALTQAATLSRVLAYDRLVGENLALRTRVDEVDGQLSELSALIQRVRGYDDQLRSLSRRSALPGFGMLDADEAAAREAWLDRVVPPTPSSADPDANARSLTLNGRAERVVAELRAMDPRLGALEDTLAQIRAVEEVLPQMWPVEGVLTSPFGYRRSPFTREWKFHGGIDLGVPQGTPILVTGDGLVTFSGWDGGHGMMIEVDHGSGVATRYCHASQLLVEAGDGVVAGDMIALSGSTGMSTGPHLHYEIHFDGERADPLDYLPQGDASGVE